jgi:23S rRNA (adenine2503-C2)-methyltransferase
MKNPESSMHAPQILTRLESADGETRKDLLQMEDGEQVEVVLLRYGQRCSACISTQVGCTCGCVFCATGQMGFVRQLESDEIIAQALHVQRELASQGKQLSNVVLMGMGEPLLNYEQTMAAIRHLVDQREMGLAPSRVTLSTVGIADEIERMAEESVPIKLAVSLHAATDDLRDRLVPINRRYPLDALFAAVEQYTARTERRVMFEWVMIDGINDTQEQMEQLAYRLSRIPCHVNLIRLNPTDHYSGRPANPDVIEAFARALDRAAIPHTMRQRRGSAIQAGCGQLRTRAARCAQRTSSTTHPQEP